MEIVKIKVDLEPGNIFVFAGREWIILDPDCDGGILAITKEIWKETPFNEDRNDANWKTSTLRKDMIENLLPELGEENLLPHMTDMVCDNGDDSLGKVEDKVFILSCDEYRKYRKYIPLHDEWMWTCTPWYVSPHSGYAYYPRYVYSGGGVSNGYAFGSSGAVPACIFNPKIFESAPAGAPVKEVNCMEGYLVVVETKVKARKVLMYPENYIPLIGEMVVGSDGTQGEIQNYMAVYKSDCELIPFISSLVPHQKDIPKVVEIWKRIKVSDDDVES